MVTLPRTEPDPLPSIRAVFAAVESKVRKPPVFNVPLLISVLLIVWPAVLIVVVLPDPMVRLLNDVADEPAIVCAPVLFRYTRPLLFVNVPLLVQLP
jgi:hypothetical protein